jgi:hypothetical protein
MDINLGKNGFLQKAHRLNLTCLLTPSLSLYENCEGDS